MTTARDRSRLVWLGVPRRLLLSDAAIGLALGVFAITVAYVGSDDEPGRQLGVADAIAAVVTVLAVTARRRWARVAIAAVTLTSVLLTVANQEQPVLTTALLFLFYTFATRVERRTAWMTAGGVAGVLYLTAVLWADGGWAAPENLGAFAWVGLATAVGDATRSRRAYIAEVEERARRAEQTRDDEARRRVVEERLRIARELHDVVAHHIAVIKVQATGARHILEYRPEQVGPALDHISRSSDAVLKEIASVLGLLRSRDEPEASGDDDDSRPTRGLARLTTLLDDLAAAGLQVNHRQVGVARILPALVDLAAYRIVQEALTNAHKYGDGTARLTVAYAPEDITVEITNKIRHDSQGTGSGFGIVGMRERAAATGGSVTAAREQGGQFVVRAGLPAVAEATS